MIAVLNAMVPPAIAALRLPYTVASAFVLVLLADALMLRAASAITEGAIEVSGFGAGLVAALIASAVTTALSVVLGSNDEEEYSLRVVHRLARRSGERVATDVPGIVYLEIDGLAKPVLQRAMRDGTAPTMARWLADGTHRLAEWEPDLSSQTGASQAGILLGSNDDIPAFRWVEKERGMMMVCSNPDDCAEIERRRSTGQAAARGRRRQPRQPPVGRRRPRAPDREPGRGREERRIPATARSSRTASTSCAPSSWSSGKSSSSGRRRRGRRRRDVRPRGHRSGMYPLVRAGVCVAVSDITVYSVISDMFIGRPAIYATFASYDEVAHHSGLERPDTLEALRKLDEQFGRIEQARRYAPRPYRHRRPLRPRADAGGDVQAAERLRPRRARAPLDRRVPRPRRRRRGREPLGRRHGVRRGDGEGQRERQEARGEERRERRGGGRARLGQPRPRLPDGASRGA